MQHMFEDMMERKDVERHCNLDFRGNVVWTFVHREWVFEYTTRP